jgi:serine/threonine protein kinase
MTSSSSLGGWDTSAMELKQVECFLTYLQLFPTTCAGYVQEHVKREKSLMADCDSPFLTNLVSSFKDNTHLYLLLECVMGGELFTYLQVWFPSDWSCPFKLRLCIAACTKDVLDLKICLMILYRGCHTG